MYALQVQDLSKSFGGVRAVHGASFEIAEGKITGLIGPNGAGKTTLFNLVNGFIPADEGRVFLHGRDVTASPVWERSRLGMSRTFQQSRLLKNLSIRENLILAIRQDDDKFWKNVLKTSVNILPRSRSDVNKKEMSDLDEKIKEVLTLFELHKDPNMPVTDLSYGQQKLFDLARALLNPHTVLLLDEPAAGLNPVIREKLKTILKRLKSGAAPAGGRETILLIEHDIDFVRSVADWVIVMDQGSVLTQGEPEKVLKDKRVLDAYLGTTAEK